VQSDQALAMIDYHQKYVRYLGIYSGPVVFVSGEVLGPQADLREIKAVINRKLQVPDAGTWD
jgi:protein-disulfide isomerase